MTAGAKIPLQAVVSTICEALADLPPDDQARALEAVRVTLGLDTPITQSARASALAQEEALSQEPSAPEPLWDPALFHEAPAPRALPTVVVEMMGDRPRVVSRQIGRPGRALVVVGPQRSQRRQLPAPCAPVDRAVRAEDDALPHADASQAQLPGGSRRGGYVRSIR